MKRWLILLFLGAWAWAAPVTTVYDSLSRSLAQAESQKANQVRALETLRNAEDVFRNQATEMAPVLRDGILTNLSDARVALSRRSDADFQARLTVIRGLLSKALYDDYFAALSQGQAAQANGLLTRLLSASSLSANIAQQAAPLVRANTPQSLENLRRLLERSFAQGIINALQRALQGNSTQAYLQTSRAYALYLVIQERSGQLSAQGFIDALTKLSQGNNQGFRADVTRLLQATQTFLRASAPISAPVPATPAPSTTTAQPTPAPAASTPPAPAAEPAAAAPTPQPTPAPVASTPSAPAAQPATPAPTPVAPSPTAPVVTPDVMLEADTLANIDSFNTFVSDLSTIVQDRAKAERIAQQIAPTGVDSIAEWQNAVLNLKGQLLNAQTQVKTGNFDQARATIQQIEDRYRRQILPIVEAVRPDVAQRNLRLLELMGNAVGLRTNDFTILAADIEEAELALQGRDLGWSHRLQVEILLFLLGLPRALLFILLGLQAALPIYLIFLTFGGRNVYWRLLGLSFLFLLLPAIFEGISYMGSILSDSRYGSLGFLSGLAGLSIQQNLFAQTFWAFTLVLVVVFAYIGLRGIAEQFGLLTERRKAATATPQAAPSSTQTSETTVEWDEEF